MSEEPYMTTTTNIEAAALSDEQINEIASSYMEVTDDVYVSFLPSNLDKFARALLASKPAVPVQDETADGELIADLIEQNRTLRARLAAPASPIGEDAANGAMGEREALIDKLCGQLESAVYFMQRGSKFDCKEALSLVKKARAASPQPVQTERALTEAQIESLVDEFCCVEAGDLVRSHNVATEEAMRDALKSAQILLASQPASSPAEGGERE